MQEWWAGSTAGDRRRHDRVRDGDRQGRRALRLPLQPAEEPRDLLAGDRPRRPRRRGEHLRAARLPRRRADARELRLRRHADTRGARRPARGGARSIPSAPSSPSPSTSSPAATTCARSCCGPPSPTSSSTACSGRGRRSTRATGSARPGTSFDDVFGRFDERAPTSCAAWSRAARRAASGRRSTPTRRRPRSARSAAGSSPHSGTSSSRASSSCRRPRCASATRSLARPDSSDELVERLLERFERRERAETERIQRVLSLVTHDGCQVNALVGYFGETRAEPCGHCSHCLTGRAAAASRARAAAADRDGRRRRGARGAARPGTRRRSGRRASAPASSAASRARRRPARS